MSEAEMVVLFPAGALVVALVLGVLWWRRRVREQLEGLESSLDLTHPEDETTFPRPLVGSWRGYRVEVRYMPGDGRSRPSRLTFSLTAAERIPVAGTVRVRRRNVLDRLAERAGLVRRLWAPRYPGSEKIYVEADNDGYAAFLVAMEDFRCSVVPLTRYFRPWVSIDGHGVSLTLKGPLLRLIGNLRSVHVRTVLVRLKTLAELEYPSPERAAEAAPTPQTVRARPVSPGLGYTMLAILVLGIGLMYWGSRFPVLHWRPVVYGAVLGAIGVALCAAWAFRELRGHSRALRPFAAVVLMAVLGLPTGAVGALEVVNGLSDTGVARPVEGRIAAIDDWWVRVAVPVEGRGGGTSVGVRVPYARISGAVRADAPVRVTVRPGALGFPWVASVTVSGR